MIFHDTNIELKDGDSVRVISIGVSWYDAIAITKRPYSNFPITLIGGRDNDTYTKRGFLASEDNCLTAAMRLYRTELYKDFLCSKIRRIIPI